MERRNVFTFLRSIYEAAKAIPEDKVRLDFLMAVLAFGFDDEEPALTGYAKVAFCLVQPNLIANKRRSERKKTEVTPESPPEETEESPESHASNSEVTPESLGSDSIITHNSLLITHNSSAHKSGSKKEDRVQCAENVAMTNDEYKRLLDAHGEADTRRLIEILDNYKGSTGKKYKSDYRAILSWCVDRLAEEKRRKNPQAPHSGSGNQFLELLEEGAFDD